MFHKPFSLNLINGIALLILFAVSLSVGVAEFKWSSLFSLSDSQQVMFISRLPRTFAIVLTGASMAVAGMIMQILMRNRFVEPSMVGASQSAALGLLLMTLLLPAAPLLAKMSVAAVAALIGMLVFMLLIRRLPPTAQLMVPLVGIIFGGVIEAWPPLSRMKTKCCKCSACGNRAIFPACCSGGMSCCGQRGFWLCLPI